MTERNAQPLRNCSNGLSPVVALWAAHSGFFGFPRADDWPLWSAKPGLSRRLGASYPWMGSLARDDLSFHMRSIHRHDHGMRPLAVQPLTASSPEDAIPPAPWSMPREIPC